MNVKTQLKEFAQSLRHFMKQHQQLAKLEFKENMRFVSIRLGCILACVPLLLVGYGFLCAAVAMALSQVMALHFALLLIGALHVLGVIVALAIIGHQLSNYRMMKATQTELKSTKALLKESMHAQK